MTPKVVRKEPRSRETDERECGLLGSSPQAWHMALWLASTGVPLPSRKRWAMYKEQFKGPASAAADHEGAATGFSEVGEVQLSVWT